VSPDAIPCIPRLNFQKETISQNMPSGNAVSMKAQHKPAVAFPLYYVYGVKQFMLMLYWTLLSALKRNCWKKNKKIKHILKHFNPCMTFNEALTPSKTLPFTNDHTLLFLSLIFSCPYNSLCVRMRERERERERETKRTACEGVTLSAGNLLKGRTGFGAQWLWV